MSLVLSRANNILWHLHFTGLQTMSSELVCTVETITAFQYGAFIRLEKITQMEPGYPFEVIGIHFMPFIRQWTADRKLVEVETCRDPSWI